MNRFKTTILLGGLTRLYLRFIKQPKYEAAAHMFIVNPFKPSLLMSFFSMHPPVEERVKRLEKI